MLSTTLLALSVLGLPLNLPRPLAGADDGPRWDGRTRVVHEWGTFTSIQGSDGVTLDGLMHEERDLPEFVYDVRDFAAITGFSPKMETPVVYFYAPEAWRVTVRVDFPRGLVTQWYPAPGSVNLRPRGSREPVLTEGQDTAPLVDGFAIWGERGELTVLAPEDFAPEGEAYPEQHASLPPVDAEDPWGFARQVRANLLRVHNVNKLHAALEEAGEEVERQPFAMPVMDEHERFLFYRGLGDFPLPLSATVRDEELAGDRYSVSLSFRNDVPRETLKHVFLVYVEGGRCGFARLPDIADELDVERVDMELDSFTRTTDLLVERLAVALAETGLYYDEALAMARTWQSGYFQDEGLRVLYVLPETFVERELPLSVTSRRHYDPEQEAMVPGPEVDELVRTFVARTELLSPRREERMLATVRGLEADDAARRAAAVAEVQRWGRFAAPYLQRVQALREAAR